MNKKDAYDQIAELAEWVNANRIEVAEDGMNIIIAIADSEKIRRMCLTGNSVHLGQMFDVLLEGAYNEWHKTMDNKDS